MFYFFLIIYLKYKTTCIQVKEELIDFIIKDLETNRTVIDFYHEHKNTGFYCFASNIDNFINSEIEVICSLLKKEKKFKNTKINVLKSNIRCFLNEFKKNRKYLAFYMNLLRYYKNIIEDKNIIDISDGSNIGNLLYDNIIKLNFDILENFIKNQKVIEKKVESEKIEEPFEVLLISNMEFNNDILYFMINVFKNDFYFLREVKDRTLIFLIVSFSEFVAINKFKTNLEVIFNQRNKTRHHDILYNSGLVFFFEPQSGITAKNTTYNNLIESKQAIFKRKKIFNPDDYLMIGFGSLDLIQIKDEKKGFLSSRTTTSIKYNKNSEKFYGLNVEIYIENKICDGWIGLKYQTSFKKREKEKFEIELFKLIYFEIYNLHIQEARLYKVKINQSIDTGIINEIEEINKSEYNSATVLTPETYDILKNNLSELLHPETYISEFLRNNIKSCFYENKYIHHQYEPLFLSCEMHIRDLDSFFDKKLRAINKFNETTQNKYHINFYDQQYHNCGSRVTPGKDNIYFQFRIPRDIWNGEDFVKILLNSTFNKSLFDQIEKNMKYLTYNNIILCLNERNNRKKDIYILFDIVHFYRRKCYEFYNQKLKEILSDLIQKANRIELSKKKLYFQRTNRISLDDVYKEVEKIFGSKEFRSKIIHPKNRKEPYGSLQNMYKMWDYQIKEQIKLKLKSFPDLFILSYIEYKKRYFELIFHEICDFLDLEIKKETLSKLNIYIFSPEYKNSPDMTKLCEILSLKK